MFDESKRKPVEAIRSFNRFYTNRIGLLSERLNDSPFSLTEGRIVHELYYRREVFAADLVRDLNLDPGYVSRIINRLQRDDLLDRIRSPQDGRRRLIRLTQRGRDIYEQMEAQTNVQMEEMLLGRPEGEVNRLLEAMADIRKILASDDQPGQSFLLRPHEPGDMGWIIRAHGAYYHREHGYGAGFEALAARICADFLDNYDPKTDRCWIAELDRQPVGSAMVVHDGERRSRLRLLLVDPRVRGLGLGRRLVSECVRFARRSRAKTLVLWTDRELEAAIHLYAQAGFELIKEEPHNTFGLEMVGQHWELKL